MARPPSPPLSGRTPPGQTPACNPTNTILLQLKPCLMRLAIRRALTAFAPANAMARMSNYPSALKPPTSKSVWILRLAAQSDLAKIGIEFKPTPYPGRHLLCQLLRWRQHGNRQVRYGWLHHRLLSRSDDRRVMDSYACEYGPEQGKPLRCQQLPLCDPKLDELMAAVNASVDPAVRKTALDALQKYIYRSVLCGHDVCPSQRVRLCRSLCAWSLRLLKQHELERRSLGCQVSCRSRLKCERQGIPASHTITCFSFISGGRLCGHTSHRRSFRRFLHF